MKRALIKRINDIKEIIKRAPHMDHFICLEAMCNPFEQEITDMVKMHIGEQYTVETFLKKQWSMHSNSTIENEVSNSYRICMLNNMIRMVESGEYKV